MTFLVDLFGWFTDPANWQGANGIPNRVMEHVQLSAFAVACAVTVAVPVGVWLGHIGRGGAVVSNLVNVGRALPTFAVMGMAKGVTLSWGLGLRFAFWSTWVAMFLLALPPIFTNTYAAIRGVDPSAVAAARGMGLRERGVVFEVELPMATPVMLAAIRVSAVQVIATVPLGAIIGWGGLGRYIIGGLATRNFVLATAGALLVAALVVVAELTFSAVERITLPKGVQRLSHADAEDLISRAA
jgi:osmoprotectant transport system permease protein